MLIKSALRDWLYGSYSLIRITMKSHLRWLFPPLVPYGTTFPPRWEACHTILRSLCSLTNRVPLPPHPRNRINRSMLSCRDMAPWLSTHSPTTKWGEGGGASHQRGIAFSRPQGGCMVLAAKGGMKMAPERALTSPAGTVSQPIVKPFNGQAKGLLWLTWRSCAGPPQYYITPEGGALNPSGRRQPVPDRTLDA